MLAKPAVQQAEAGGGLPRDRRGGGTGPFCAGFQRCGGPGMERFWFFAVLRQACKEGTLHAVFAVYFLCCRMLEMRRYENIPLEISSHLVSAVSKPIFTSKCCFSAFLEILDMRTLAPL